MTYAASDLGYVLFLKVQFSQGILPRYPISQNTKFESKYLIRPIERSRFISVLKIFKITGISAILLIISLGICGALAVRAHMRRKRLLEKILQLQFNKTIAEVGLALIAPIQGWKFRV